jgi:hypothetical protein
MTTLAAACASAQIFNRGMAALPVAIPDVPEV